MRAALFALVVAVGASCPGTVDPGDACDTATDCGITEACRDGHCVPLGEGEGEGDAGEGEGEGDIGEGEGDVVGQCSTAAQCTGGAFCSSPDDPAQCGAPPPVLEDECADTPDCAAIDSVCDFAAGPCSTGHLVCVSPCASDADCGRTELCNAGRCEAQACQDGFLCPSWTACGNDRPNPLSDDSHHGCIAVPCTTDQDCPEPTGGFVVFLPTGFCVNGVCASGPGQCELPVP